MTPQPSPISTCIMDSCLKPLGERSKSEGYLTCHEHRLCTRCGTELKPSDIRLAQARLNEAQDLSPDTKLYLKYIQSTDGLELAHSRCLIKTAANELSLDPTISIKQSLYDLLNNARLMISPDTNLSITTNENNALLRNAAFVKDMTWEERNIHLSMMEACVAATHNAIAQDPKIRKQLVLVRDNERVKQAKVVALTGSKPISPSKSTPNTLPEDFDNAKLAAYMLENGITDRKVGLKKHRDFEKAIEAMLKNNPSMPRDMAVKMCQGFRKSLEG